MPESVPGDRWKSGKAALADLLVGATTVQAAVAFVTDGGVTILNELITGLTTPRPRFEIIARAAPVTDPEALIRLRDELDVSVSVVGAPKASRFHPKLWLIEAEGEMRVLSGSGNLTGRGLEGNREQFEVWTVDENGAQQQRRRFAELTDGAMPLGHFQETPQWQTWIEQQERRRDIEHEADDLYQDLLDIGSAEADLDNDLWQLYHDMKGQLKEEETGHIYNRGAFRLTIQGLRGPKTSVEILSSLCRETRIGFERARRNNRLDLAAEVLAVDPTKSYHELIDPEIRTAAAQRLRKAEADGCAPSGV